MNQPRARAAGIAVRPRRAISMRELASEFEVAPHMSREILAWLEALGAPLIYGNRGQAILIEEEDLGPYRERLEALIAQYLERTAKSA